jgi:flagellar biosynthetic protein FliQ
MDLLQLAMWTVAVICAPPIAAAMIVGTVIALLQALTQVQEATLTFVPKIVAVMIAVVLSNSLIGTSLQNFADVTYARIESRRN